ncbi:uncharacterized protein [Primulina huaijiensis]|uniref:uncharacterized protein n=1 Tax=Primulina huaijiensis TaxID=1492673 RepID=UPI003CC6DF80
MENGKDGGGLLPIIQIYADFMTGVTKFEELGTLGSKLLVSFQQALGFLRRPPVEKTSTLFESIIKAHGTKRFLSYVEAGCKNIHDNVQNMSKLHTCHLGLQDHINKAGSIVSELERLLDDAASIVQTTEEQDEDVNSIVDSFTVFSSTEEVSSSDISKPEVTDFASMMAVIYSMVKQDYTMQDRIVTSLNLKSSPSELETYCLMWSLRPFIDDDIMQQAWSLVPWASGPSK